MKFLSVEQALSKAKKLAQNNATTEAQQVYLAILKIFPKNKKAKQGLADLTKIKNQKQSLRPSIEALKDIIALYNRGQLSMALEKAQTLAEQYPTAFDAWNLLGAANQELGRINEAVIAFRKATELKPNFPEGFNNLGVALQNQNELHSAIAAFEKTLSLRPNYPEAYNNLGITLKMQGKFEPAIDAYKHAILLKPDFAKAFNNLGKPIYSTFCNWFRDGILIFPCCVMMGWWLAAPGIVYGQALSAVLAGTAAMIWGWYFVGRLAVR